MFKSQSSFQSSLFGSFAYQGILARHRDHFLVRLLSAVDFSFVIPLVEECYSGLGRKAYSPVVIMKILLLQTRYDLSERDVVEQVDTNILFRAFAGLHWMMRFPIGRCLASSVNALERSDSRISSTRSSFSQRKSAFSTRSFASSTPLP